MAAYGAATSVKNTIQRILRSSRISLVPPSQQVLQPAYEAMVRLQKVLLKLDETSCSKIRTKVNALDDRIKKVIWDFEDLVESRYSDQILPQLESVRDRLSFLVDMQSLQQSVDCFIERVTVMEAEYDMELLNMPEEDGEPLSSRIDFGGINSNMVGLSQEFEQVRDYLIKDDGKWLIYRLSEEVEEEVRDYITDDEGNWLLVTGMAGVGKTALAKKIFDDPSIQKHFELRAWVKVGRKCEFDETLRCILAQVDPNILSQCRTNEKLSGVLEERLKDKKCLIVLDDVWEWDTRVMDTLRKDKVRILLTSRKTIREYPVQVVRLLDESESKKLLGQEIFGEEGFPPYLDKVGEKISDKCEGLPLMIVTVAKLLSKEDMSPQYWTDVAYKQHNSIFVDAYNQISELSAEGFLEPIGQQTWENFMVERLVELGHRYHLFLFELDGSSWFSKKEFRVHSCWQHLCRKEASKIKFLHVLQSYDDDMKDQRRLCVHSNTLFAFKEVHDSIKSDCASTARSLLCLGTFHQYPVPIHAMDFKLLRVLDALMVRFYHIPLEILKYVCLNYIALTCNTELPNSISNLCQLQVLIITKCINIKKRGALSYMPVEIWDMQELQHIHVVGIDLPTPNSDATLDKLSSLGGVTAKSFTREILKKVPNLKELFFR
ncbi:putative late blight resistance protein homolog R1A-3 isoform X2 [Salvia hispanica]|uniref:putative late blight resistance protein homolog R1A-3 isoform X2 n=1 Tax=Salvia hispanica TaxID=49212 RepID=UPI0020090E05|nr:putative late blight resistance protein homolog R1A-3 isoform X2 [Salvia hispanica]